MQKTIQASSLNSKVGRTYTWDSIAGRDEETPNNPILEVTLPEVIPIPEEGMPNLGILAS